MVLFGQNPSQGTLLKGSEFLSGAFRQRPVSLVDDIPFVTSL